MAQQRRSDGKFGGRLESAHPLMQDFIEAVDGKRARNTSEPTREEIRLQLLGRGKNAKWERDILHEVLESNLSDAAVRRVLEALVKSGEWK